MESPVVTLLPTTTPPKTRRRKLAKDFKPSARSRVANGRDLLVGVDERRIWARRFRDVLQAHLSDLGGEDNASEAEKAIARRAACLIVQLETMEAKFARNEGHAANKTLITYQRLANSLRRLLESLGLQRRPRDITGLTLGEVIRADQEEERRAHRRPAEQEDAPS
jgi:hypothetical protein